MVLKNSAPMKRSFIETTKLLPTRKEVENFFLERKLAKKKFTTDGKRILSLKDLR